MKKSKGILITIVISILLTIVIGISYGYWSYEVSQKDINVIGTECLKIEMVEESEGIKIEKAYPISNSEGMKTTPYTFTIRNTCNSVVDYSINLESMEIEERLASEYVAVALDENKINILSNYEETKAIYKDEEYRGVESRVLLTGYLDSKESISHTLRIWLEETADKGSMNKNFVSKVIISGTPNKVIAISPNVTTINSNQKGEEIKDLEETNGYVYENQTTVNCAGERSHCYIKVEGNVEFTGSVLKKCSSENPYEECEEIEEFTGFEANVWYQTSNIITFKSKETREIPKIEYVSCVGDKCTEEKEITLTKVDKTAPRVEVERTTTSTNSASLKVNVNDLESGIESVEVKYGESEDNLVNKAILEEKEYQFIHLTNNKTYYYEIVAIDKVGNETIILGSISTKDIEIPEVRVEYQDKEGSKLEEDTEYAYEGKVSITFNDTNVHYIRVTNSEGIPPLSNRICGNGEIPGECSENVTSEMQDVWYQVSENKTLTFTSENNNYTHIKAITYDGVNYSDRKEIVLAKIDRTGPTVTPSSSITSSNTISIPLATSDPSGIKEVSCVYGSTTNYGSEGTSNTGNCTLRNLKNNTTYYYQITVTDQVGNETIKTGSAKTGEISKPTVTMTGYNKSNSTISAQNGYFYKETASINFDTTNVTTASRYIKSTQTGTSNVALVEVCGTGTTPDNCTATSGTSMSANTWYKVNGNTTITYETATSSTGTVYASIWDGVNFSTSGTGTISKIDRKAPDVTLGVSTVTTATGSIPITASDNESTLSGVTCKYGTTSGTYNLNASSATTTNCSLTGLENNKTYYYQITITDKVGNETVKTGSLKTGTMTTPTVTLKGYNARNEEVTNAINGYFYKETASINFTASGLTSSAYYVKSTSATTSSIDGYACGTSSNPGDCGTSATKNFAANTWYKVNGNPTLTYQTSNNNTATVYASIWDGAKYSTQGTGTISKIDQDPPSVPTITDPKNGGWSKEAFYITVNTSDNGSKVQKVEYSENNKTTWTNDFETVTENAVYRDSWNVERNSTVYFRACDYVGNCTEPTSGTAIKIDKSAPTLTLGTITTTTDSITIPITKRDSAISGEKSFSCTIGGKACSCSGNSCSVSGLSPNTSYNYSIVFTDNATNSTTKSGSVKTQNILYNQVSVGDYVSYTPASTSYNVANSLTGMDNYSGDDNTATNIKNAGKQTIQPSELNLWRVIRKNADGSIDIVSVYVSSANVNFYGKEGYKKYIGTLQTIASQYETSGITSGSRYMGYDGQTLNITDETALNNTTAPWTESTTAANSPKGSTREKQGGGDMLYETDTNLVKAACGNTLKAYRVDATGTLSGYHLAARNFYSYSSGSWGFRGRFLSTSGVINLAYLYRYYDGSFNEYIFVGTYGFLRPIVTLKSKIAAISGNGSIGSPWKVN